MAGNVVVDAGFLVALLSHRDSNHEWAVVQAEHFPPPWTTCEAVLSEAFHLIGARGAPALSALLHREALTVGFELADNMTAVLKLIQKYADLPASLADASLVRMTETLADPIVLTTDTDFRVYRRHGRQAVPCVTPADRLPRRS
jgi:predicted nucleic acid-binding protein